jgi:phenylalanyl-tRNA synthetase beta chain
LLDVVRRARRHGEADLRLFGVGSVFLAPIESVDSDRQRSSRPRSAEDTGALPREQLRFAAVLSGNRPSYLTKPSAYDAFDVKGIAVGLVERFTARSTKTTWVGQQPSPLPHLHPRGAAELWSGDTLVGNFGPLHPDVIDELELGGPVHVVELDLDAVELLGAGRPRYRPIPRLPAVTRDIAIEVGAALSAGEVQRAIETSAGELCESVTLIDLFEGGGMAPGQRSLAYRLVYRDPRAATDPDKASTLTDKQVDSQHEKVVRAVEKLGAVPRA